MKWIETKKINKYSTNEHNFEPIKPKHKNGLEHSLVISVHVAPRPFLAAKNNLIFSCEILFL